MRSHQHCSPKCKVFQAHMLQLDKFILHVYVSTNQLYVPVVQHDQNVFKYFHSQVQECHT